MSPAWKVELELGNKQDLLEIGANNNSEGGKRHKGNQYTGVEPLSQNDKPSIQPVNTQKEIAKAAGVSTGQAV